MHSKVNKVIASQNMSFLDSYRNHMRQITRDLDIYKKAINEKEFMNRREDKVVKL